MAGQTAQVMTESKDLKPGWKLVRFGDVVKLSKARCADPVTEGIERYVGLEHIDSDDLRIQRWGLVEDGTTFTTRFKPGQVLFGKRRAYLRKVAVADFEGICSGDIYVFESASPKILLPELLPFICQTERFFEYAIGTSAGSLSPRTNWKSLANFEFALPPMDEQRRLTQLLNSIESLHDTYMTAIDHTEQIILSKTEDFFEKLSTKLMLKVEELLAEEPRNGISPKSNNSVKGLRTVSISSISAGEFIPEDHAKYVDIEQERIEAFLVKRNDVFVVRGNGNRILTAKCGLARKSYEDLFYPDLLIRLRFDHSKIIPEFAVLQWNTPSNHHQLLSRAKSTNGIWKINGQDIREHTLLVPPLASQENLLADTRRIYKALGQLRNREKAVKQMKSLILNSRFLEVE